MKEIWHEENNDLNLKWKNVASDWRDIIQIWIKNPDPNPDWNRLFLNGTRSVANWTSETG